MDDVVYRLLPVNGLNRLIESASIASVEDDFLKTFQMLFLGSYIHRLVKHIQI